MHTDPDEAFRTWRVWIPIGLSRKNVLHSSDFTMWHLIISTHIFLERYLFKSGWRVLSSAEIGESPDCVPRHGQSCRFGQKPELRVWGKVYNLIISQNNNIEGSTIEMHRLSGQWPEWTNCHIAIATACHCSRFCAMLAACYRPTVKQQLVLELTFEC